MIGMLAGMVMMFIGLVRFHQSYDYIILQFVASLLAILLMRLGFITYMVSGIIAGASSEFLYKKPDIKFIARVSLFLSFGVMCFAHTILVIWWSFVGATFIPFFFYLALSVATVSVFFLEGALTCTLSFVSMLFGCLPLSLSSRGPACLALMVLSFSFGAAAIGHVVWKNEQEAKKKEEGTLEEGKHILENQVPSAPIMIA